MSSTGASSSNPTGRKFPAGTIFESYQGHMFAGPELRRSKRFAVVVTEKKTQADAFVKTLAEAEAAKAKEKTEAERKGKRKRKAKVKAIQYNGTTGTRLKYNDINLFVISCGGHLYDCQFKDKKVQFDVHGEYISQLFKTQVHEVLNEEKSKKFKDRWSYVKRDDAIGLILWTDTDPAGDAIAYEVMECLGFNDNETMRARCHSTRSDDIITAMDNLELIEPQSTNFSEAYNFKRVMNLRAGFAIGRYINKITKAHFGGVIESFRLGLTNLPILALVVNHQPKFRYSLTCSTEDDDDHVTFLSMKGYTGEEIVDIRDNLVGKTAKVKEIRKRVKREQQPAPLNTAVLLSRCRNELNLSPSDTMKSCDFLLRKGVISYPRTSSNCFGAISRCAEKTPQLAEALIRTYLEQCDLVNPVVKKPICGGTHHLAHEPLHAIRRLRNLTGVHYNVFNRIVNHLSACVAGPHICTKKRVIIGVQDEESNAVEFANQEQESVDFVAETTIDTEELGFRGVTDFEIPDEETSDSSLSKFGNCKLKYEVGTGKPGVLTRGERIVKLARLMVHRPNPHDLQEGQLIHMMVQEKLATSATIHSQISKLADNNLITMSDDGSIKATDRGKAIVEGFEFAAARCDTIIPLVRSPYITVLMDEDAARIRNGTETRQVAEQKWNKKLDDIFTYLIENPNPVKKSFNRFNDRLLKPKVNGQDVGGPVGFCEKCYCALILTILERGHIQLNCECYVRELPTAVSEIVVRDPAACERCKQVYKVTCYLCSFGFREEDMPPGHPLRGRVYEGCPRCENTHFARLIEYSG